MDTIKILGVFLLFSIFTKQAAAQDAVVIDSGNFVRGTIKGTNYSTVILVNDDKTITEYKAKDIKEFLWNGETFVSKPFVSGKKMEIRFFKVIELGAVNLYSMGGSAGATEPRPAKTKIRPSFGLGMGTGGYGGLGMGGGITIGGGRRDEDQGPRFRPAVYYIEKLGTGPIQPVAVDGRNSDTNSTKSILLSKLTNDEDLAERIKSTEVFDAKNIKAFISAYNAMHK